MTKNQRPISKRKRMPRGTGPPPRVSVSPSTPLHDLELYHVIVHCRDEAQQCELFERLRREGFRCRLSVL